MRGTLKSRIEQGGHVRPSKTHLNCKPSGIPTLEEDLSEYCDEPVLCTDGVRSALGRVYQSSSIFGIAVETNTQPKDSEFMPRIYEIK